MYEGRGRAVDRQMGVDLIAFLRRLKGQGRQSDVGSCPQPKWQSYPGGTRLGSGWGWTVSQRLAAIAPAVSSVWPLAPPDPSGENQSPRHLRFPHCTHLPQILSFIQMSVVT